MRVQKVWRAESTLREALTYPKSTNSERCYSRYLVGLREPAPADSHDKAAARSSVVPFVKALIEDFNNRWGSGNNVLTY